MSDDDEATDPQKRLSDGEIEEAGLDAVQRLYDIVLSDHEASVATCVRDARRR